MTAPGWGRSAGYMPAAGVTDQDVRAAQAAIDGWVEACVGLEDSHLMVSTTAALRLRGILAGWAADLREAGYAEGVAAGRVEGSRQAARVVLDALQGEGLA